MTSTLLELLQVYLVRDVIPQVVFSSDTPVAIFRCLQAESLHSHSPLRFDSLLKWPSELTKVFFVGLLCCHKGCSLETARPSMANRTAIPFLPSPLHQHPDVFITPKLALPCHARIMELEPQGPCFLLPWRSGTDLQSCSCPCLGLSGDQPHPEVITGLGSTLGHSAT